MDPGTALLLASAASAAANLAAGVQAYQQGRYEAQVAGTNARIATENAARARQDAARAEEAHRREARKALGRAAAASSQSGAAGGGPGQGSFGAVNTQSAREAELDALNIRYGGEMEAYGNLTEAALYRAERKAALTRAKGGLITGILGAGAAGLSGVSDYRSYRQSVALRRPSTASPRTSVPTAARGPRIDPYHRRP